MYAQLGMQRAAVSMLGQLRALLWTDHANVKRLQAADEIDVKHLRWVSEIIADGSTMNSLSGRSALLGDGYSRNPKGSGCAARTAHQGPARYSGSVQRLSLIHI